MLIECSRCEMFETDQCSDCLVTALLGMDDGEMGDSSVEIDDEFHSPLSALSNAGLIPVLKFQARPEPPGHAEAG
jgi:hypothetical protein